MASNLMIDHDMTDLIHINEPTTGQICTTCQLCGKEIPLHSIHDTKVICDECKHFFNELKRLYARGDFSE